MSNIKINLMLKEYAPPRKAGALEWGLAAAAMLGAVVGSLYYMGVAADAEALTRQGVNQEQRLHRVKAQLAEVELIGNREVRVAQAEGELQGLVGRRWSHLLLTLRDLTPQEVTWQVLSIDHNTMTLTATSRGLIDVAQLFSGLTVHPQVDEVALRYVNEKGITVEFKAEPAKAEPGKPQPVPEAQIRPPAQFRLLEFEISITLLPPEGRTPHGA